MRKLKPLKNKVQWAYFAPDGHIQTRSIADTRKDSREQIVSYSGLCTYKDYESEGFTIHKILVDIKILK